MVSESATARDPKRASTDRFCIIATPRTGSNFIRFALTQLPGVACHGELFSRRTTADFDGWAFDRGLTLARLGFSLAGRDDDPVGFLAQVERMTLGGAAMCGFKLMANHSRIIFHHVLASADYRIVVLSRRNKLAQFSSNEIARASGVWAGAQPGPQTKILFDAQAFATYVEQDGLLYDTVASGVGTTRQAPFAMDYTDIKKASVFEALLAFLDIEPRVSVRELIGRSPFLRQNTSNIIDRFSNPEAVQAAMRRLGHEDWLREDES